MRYDLHMNSSGDGHDNSDDPFGSDDNNGGNVIEFKVPRKKAAQAENPKKDQEKESSEPLLNIPTYSKYMLGLFIGIHLIVFFGLSEQLRHSTFIHLGFIPGRFTGEALFEPLALLTPFSHMLLHGSWLHLAMNGVMLLAFGSGIERWLGGQKMLLLFVFSGLIGVAAHFTLNYSSIQPVVGASGGISGLFAAALIMINRMQGGAGKIWPFILLWIGISVLFGFMGSPDGGDVAWAAHIGGFLGGFAVLKWMKVF